MKNNLAPAPPVLAKHSQKLVTIYLDNMAYTGGKMMVGSFADKHGMVEEHLAPFLADGWSVVQIHGFGGVTEGLAARGWITVLLERG